MSETSVVERLAERWSEKNPDRPLRDCDADARWWMEAIAAVLEEESDQASSALRTADIARREAHDHMDRSFALFRAARFLRTAATPEEGRE